MEEQRIIGVGIAEEQADFLKRHDLFMKRFPNLQRTFEAAFIRQFSSAEPADRVVFSLGRLCVEDFMEILVLSGNGYGIGALKILRGMYEKAITALYLHAKPEEAESFLDYYWIAQHKLAQAVIETFGDEVLPKDKLEETYKMYEQVKDKFMVTACRKCDSKQLNHTWSKLDFVSMARAAGSLGKFIVPAYYLPLQHTHATIRAILARLKEVGGDGIAFTGYTQKKEADDALMLSHLITLNTVTLQREHFKLESLQPELDVCNADYLEIWHGSPKDKPTSV